MITRMRCTKCQKEMGTVVDFSEDTRFYYHIEDGTPPCDPKNPVVITKE